jgi:hypothetical protein
MALDGTCSNKNVRKGDSLGDVPQNWTPNNKNSIYFGLLCHYQEYKYYGFGVLFVLLTMD